MKNMKLLLFVVLPILMSSSVSSLCAQDWPQWRGPARDGKAAGFSAPDVWPEELTLVWSVNVGAGDATPAIVGDMLYVFTRQDENEVLLCLDKNSGKELWTSKYEAQAVTGAAARHPGPRSSPAVAENKIITLGVGGILSCLEASSGKVVWRKDPFPGVVPMFFTAMSPMIVNNMCIAQLGGAGNGAVISYDLKTGDEIWRWSEEGPDYASPVLLTHGGTKQIVTLTEKSIVGLDLEDGSLLWKLPFPPQRRAYNAATPIIEGQTVIYTGAGRGTKAVKIEKKGDGFTAREIWSNDEMAVQFNTPVLKDDLLFGYSNMGYLFCLDAQTGHTAWVDTVKHDRGGFAAILNAGPVILALPSSAELIAIEPVSQGFSELANIKVSETEVYAHPVIDGHRIYIKDAETIKLYTFD